MKVKLLSRVRLLATPWTAVYQAPLSMGFSRHEYWSGERHINISTKLQYLKIYVALKIFSLLIYVMLSSFQSSNVVMNQREMVKLSTRVILF